MDRRMFFGVVSTAVVGVSGCVDSSAESFEAEVFVMQGGFEEYSGSVRVLDGESGAVLLSETFVKSIEMDEDETDDGVQTGQVVMGGYFYVELTEARPYDVVVELESGTRAEYEWIPRELHRLSIRTSPDSVSFEETEKTFEENPLG